MHCNGFLIRPKRSNPYPPFIAQKKKRPTRTHIGFIQFEFCGVLNENCFWFYKLWPRIYRSSHIDEIHLEIPSCFLIIFFHFQYFSFCPAQQGISSMRAFVLDFAKRIFTYHIHTHTLFLFHFGEFSGALVWGCELSHIHKQRQIARINLDGADQAADLNFKQWLHMAANRMMLVNCFVCPHFFSSHSQLFACFSLLHACVYAGKLDELHEKHFQNMQFSFWRVLSTFHILPIFTRILIILNNKRLPKEDERKKRPKRTDSASAYSVCNAIHSEKHFSHTHTHKPHTSISVTICVAISNVAHVEQKLQLSEEKKKCTSIMCVCRWWSKFSI